MVWFYLASVTMVTTAVIHSVLGERRLIGPLLAIEAPLLRNALARQILRYAWHLTSVLMGLSAVLVVWPLVPIGLIRLTGLVWLFVGIADAALTKGKHLGWPFLAASGAFALVGTFA